MDATEAKIWVVLTLYGGVALAIFTAGLFALNDQHYAFGVAFTVIGMGAVIDAGRRVLGHGFHVSNSVLAVVLVLTWVFFGYDIYDRHLLSANQATPANAEIVEIPTELKHYAPLVPLIPEQTRVLNIMKGLAVTWGKYPYEEVHDQTFHRETVLLDGCAFINCTFDNVTFVYEGTAPFRMEGQKIVGPLTLMTDAPAVKGTINAYIYQGIGTAENRPGLPQ